MTTSHIEEIAKAIREKVGLDDIQTANVVTALTQAHQVGKKEGIDEAVEIVKGKYKVNSAEEHERRRDHSTKSGYEQALDDTIKALTI